MVSEPNDSAYDRSIGLFAYWGAEQLESGWSVGCDFGLPDDPYTWPRSRPGPAIGAWVLDSSVGYLAAAESGEIAAELVVNSQFALENGLPIHEGGEEAFARWSRNAPRQISAERVGELLAAEVVMAEETIAELFRELGLDFPEP